MCSSDLEPRERSWNRLRTLIKRRQVLPLVLGFDLPVQQRGETLFADWRTVADRFPGLARSVEKLLDGRTLGHVDRQYLRGVMQSWAEWYGIDEMAHRFKWSQNARDETLRGMYQELVANGVDPFGGYHV